MAQTLAELNLITILNEEIDWRYKGFPPTAQPVTIGQVGDQGWHALDGDLLFPLLLIKERALQHNIDLMARYCREHGVSLAPHGKTPIAPQIVQRQLAAGAWGITAATIHQARVFRAFGVRRILLANELLEPAGIRWAADEMARDPEFEFLVLVDSLEGAQILDAALTPIAPRRPLRLLLEVGAPGGRAGIRDGVAVRAVAAAIRRSPHLELAGVEAYEGAVPATTIEERIAAVDRYLQQVRDRTTELAAAGFFAGLPEIIVTAGGSLLFDRVVETLAAPWQLGVPVRTILRSGSYVTHDFDSYERTSPLAARGAGPDRLQVALELWAMILSRPEPDLAIAGFGKRDAPYDLALPVPFAIRRGGATRPSDGALTVTVLNDQHAFIRVAPGTDLAVGDLVGVNVAHPCTAFDKWRLLPLVDEDYRVTGAIKTFF
jgi:D-serine deaminase-like pyridoxal phosphate-dependent protein